jgi:hypothetical protein
MADLVALWRDEDDSGPCTLSIFGPIEEHGPVLQVRKLFHLLCLVPISEEIDDGLRLDGLAWLILDAMGTNFDGPLGDSSSRIAIAMMSCSGADETIDILCCWK